MGEKRKNNGGKKKELFIELVEIETDYVCTDNFINEQKYKGIQMSEGYFVPKG